MALTKASRSMLNTGISDSSDATALTFDSSENATFAGTITSTGTITGNLTGNVTGNLTGNASGTAATVTTAAQTAITSLGTLTGLTTSGAATIGGNLTVTGNLQVDGTTTTINSTSYTVDDKNITLASGAGSSSAADGGGITIDGANATWNYVHSTTSWDSNKAIRSTNGFVGPLTGNVTGNTSGTAATVTGAAQSAITSVGTLTGLTITGGNGDQLLLNNAGERFTQLTLQENGTTRGALWVDGTDNYVDLYANTSHGIRLKTGGDNPRLTIDSSGNATFAAHLIVDGNTTLGNADTDTVTIPGPLAVDTDTLYVDITNDRVSINSGTSPSEALHVTGNIKATGTFIAETSLSTFQDRIKILNGSAQLNIGQWDTANHRIEGDANRPIFITSYHSGGISLGSSGATKFNVNNSGVTVTGAATVSGNAQANRFVLDAPASGGTRYLYTDNTNTGTGRLALQSGGGSAGYGGGLSLFSHSHASKPGWVTAGLSLDAGTTDASDEARFTVNTQGLAGGTDLFTVLRSGKVGIGTTTPSCALEVVDNSANQPGTAFKVYSSQNSAATDGLVYIFSDQELAPFTALNVRQDGTGLGSDVNCTKATDNRTVAIFEGQGINTSQAAGGQYVSITRTGPISNASSNVCGGLLLANGSSVTAANCGIRGTYEYNSGRNLQFFTSSDNSSAPTNKMIIKGDGTVGIGTDGTVGGANGTPGLQLIRADGSFSGAALQVQAARGASSSYGLADFYSGTASDRQFNLKGDGNAYADGSWSGGGADYAEYFEWADGNSSNQDRVGYSVSLVNNKIKIAESGETVIGVISGNPAVVGDNSWDSWKNKYQKDDYGRYILSTPDGYRTPNPDYNDSLTYIPREDRKEWDIVGLMGKLRIRKGQQTGTNWIKMRDVSSSVEEWLVR